MIRTRTRVTAPWRRDATRRGTPSLLADIAAVSALTGAAGPSARTRLEAAVGPALLAELGRATGAGASRPTAARRRQAA